MSSEQFDLFLILLKLKSYLVSLVDKPEVENDPFELTEEFLDRKYPDRKEEILELLTSFKINSDAEIAFDEKMHLKFKEMVKAKEGAYNLSSILEKFKIESIQESMKEKTLDEVKTAREDKLKQIVALLVQLARIWTQRSELEDNAEDFAFLEEEDVIRPDEQKELGKLDHDTAISFNMISRLSQLYLEQLIEYYFDFGGDVALSDFIKNLDQFKTMVQNKYKDLFNKSGLDNLA